MSLLVLAFGKLPTPNITSVLGFVGGNYLQGKKSPSDMREER